MSAAYNNQWVLARSRARWRRRASATSDGDLGHPPAPPPQEPQWQPPGIQERPRPASGRAVRKRPRWIDRDT